MTLPSAHLHQERHVEIVIGAAERFVITSEMYSAVIPDQLPHLNIFVLQIKDRLDPDDDLLVRVARISDLTTLPQLRATALLTPGIDQLFLSPVVVTAYTTLSEAVTASNVIKDRVSALVTDWMSFYTDFNAPDPTEADILIPTTDVSQKQALIDAYALAKKTWYAQKVAVDGFVAAEATATATLNALMTLYNHLTAFAGDVGSSAATQVNAETSTETAAFTSLLRACNAAYPFVDVGHQPALLTAITLATPQDALGAGYVTHTGNLLSAITTYRRTLDITAAQAALTAATSARISAQANLTFDAAAAVAAWNALFAIAPDFVKTIVPYVPGLPDIGPP